MRKFKRVLFVLLIVFGIQLYIDANLIEISNYEIASDKVPENFNGYKLLHLSDLHSKEFGEDNNILIQAIDTINPDIILMTGDMVTASDTNFDIFLDFAKNIGVRYECYYIVGNHELDLKNKDYDYIMSTLDEYGVVVLDNETIKLEREGQSLNLYGMWHNAKYYMKDAMFSLDVMETIIGNDDQERFDILLTHNPNHFEVYASWGADLVLSGHIHGGMVRLPYLGPIFSPERTLLPTYSQGEYKLDETSLIVSRGLGRGATGFRLFNRPEIGVIILKSK